MHMQPAMEVEEMPDAVYAPASPCSLFVTVIVTDDELLKLIERQAREIQERHRAGL